uniref:Uncharacterized protein n=1 Tax=Romanomermis culicivorax TaxID=13658 RepID=A0A915I054_ROMCU
MQQSNISSFLAENGRTQPIIGDDERIDSNTELPSRTPSPTCNYENEEVALESDSQAELAASLTTEITSLTIIQRQCKHLKDVFQ